MMPILWPTEIIAQIFSSFFSEMREKAPSIIRLTTKGDNLKRLNFFKSSTTTKYYETILITGIPNSLKTNLCYNYKILYYMKQNTIRKNDSRNCYPKNCSTFTKFFTVFLMRFDCQFLSLLDQLWPNGLTKPQIIIFSRSISRDYSFYIAAT